MSNIIKLANYTPDGLRKLTSMSVNELLNLNNNIIDEASQKQKEVSDMMEEIDTAFAISDIITKIITEKRFKHPN